jgi:hypothetical protein
MPVTQVLFKMRNLISVTLFAVTLAGCSATTRLASEETFRITARQADRIILDSIHEGWHNQDTEALGEGKIGYKFRLWWKRDYDDITAEALPHGNNVYSFRVVNFGSAPYVGDPARIKLITLIVKKAKAVSRQ